MKNKIFFNSLFFTFSLIGSFFVLDKPLKANESPVCPDPSTTPITGIGTFAKTDSNSFWSRTGEGFCRTTPDQYGVTVFKMGFCKNNPGNPTGSSILEGSEPDYSSCTWSFESTTGEIADFSAGGSIDLSEAASSEPALGTYSHAVMLISKDFRIKGKYGPVGGKTYYSISEFDASSTNISDYAPTNAPLKSFSGPTECTATTEGNAVDGGTMSAYLLDSTGTILVSDTEEGDSDTVAPCTGQEKLLGVMDMSNDLTISDATNGLEMTFTVTNAMSVMIENGALVFDSNAFSVTFETF